MSLIGYARVSTEDQATDAQVDALTAAGCAVIFREHMSGAKATRPELLKALGKVQRGDVLGHRRGYVAQGRARMRILDPDVTLDEYELETGDVYFVPRAYPHHIEVLGDEAFHFLIFFDQPTPGDIGYRTTATAFSREVLASTLGVDERDVPDFPFTTADPLIVARKNPTPPAKSA